MDKIIILDFGSQYTQLIARKIREMNVYAKILPHYSPFNKIKIASPKGIILSGGAFDNLHIDKRIFDLNVPVLGICYGLQLIAKLFKGHIEPSSKEEYGKTELIIQDDIGISSKSLFAGCSSPTTVWMSHENTVTIIPKDFKVIALTNSSDHAAIKHKEKHIYGIQFHPEVHHTPYGKRMLHNFVFRICNCKDEWQISEHYIDLGINKIKDQIKDGYAICALSGGVDSSVAATLVHKAIGDRLLCINVDTGLLRANEAQSIQNLFNDHLHVNFDFINAEDIFLKRLKGVIDPEEKRKIIGKTFIEIFEDEAKKQSNKTNFLVQGTLYPDVIESTSVKGPSATIKSHHNVGGLPDIMDLELVEPLRELFKDEVREMGKALGLPKEVWGRHPFPGPGLAIRCIGEITKEKLEILRKADNIFINELHKWNLYDKIWQAFVVLTSERSVGVMGDNRTYDYIVVLRAVTSVDGMTADWAKLPYDFLEYVANKILNEVKGVNRVTYDITSKPPGTIEYE